MNHYRYASTLRPFTQLNLRRLEACELSCRDHVAFNHGTMAFHRRLTDFEVSQLDLVPLGFEVGSSYCADAPNRPEPEPVQLRFTLTGLGWLVAGEAPR